MFIVWGKKAVYRKLGHVADFCPVCRGPRPFLLQRIGMAGHVYYITAGEGELVGHQRSCQSCRTQFAADPRNYRATAKKPDTVEALQAQTFPGLRDAWAGRLALEDQVRDDLRSLTPEERKGLLRDPFVHLSRRVEARFAATSIDKETGLAIVGAFVLPLLVSWLTERVAPEQTDPAVLTAVVMGIGAVVWVGAQTGRRYMRREIAPVLRQCLAPLRPSTAEIEAVKDELKAAGHKIGKKLDVRDLAFGSQAAGTPGMAAPLRRD